MASTGDYVRAARSGSRTSQAELAQALGISEITYKRREGDSHHAVFTDEDLQKIAEVTGYPLHFLTYGPDYQGPAYQVLSAVVTEQKEMISRLTDAVTIMADAMMPASPTSA